MKIIKRVFVGVIALLCLVGTWSFVQDYFEISRQLDIFSSVYKEVNQFYVDEVKPGELLKKGIGGMLKNLDPYTVYYPDAEIEDYRLKNTGGEYGGIGASSFRKGDLIVIADVYEDRPAAKARVQNAMKIVAERQHRMVQAIADAVATHPSKPSVR